MTLTYLALFAGYGGLEMGVQSVLGGELVAYSEFEPPTPKNPRPKQGAARIMAHHHPGVPNLGDVTRINWRAIGPGVIDVVTGGSPCQDISTAGRQAGMRAGNALGPVGLDVRRHSDSSAAPGRVGERARSVEQ